MAAWEVSCGREVLALGRGNKGCKHPLTSINQWRDPIFALPTDSQPFSAGYAQPVLVPQVSIRLLKEPFILTPFIRLHWLLVLACPPANEMTGPEGGREEGQQGMEMGGRGLVFAKVLGRAGVCRSAREVQGGRRLRITTEDGSKAVGLHGGVLVHLWLCDMMAAVETL